jgi:hypothetical protein
MQIAQGNYLQNKIAGFAGSTVKAGHERFIGGNLWTNPTGGDLIIPSPSTTTNLEAAGFQQISGSGSSSQPSHPINPEDILYTALKNRMSAGLLEVDKWYRITDFRSINKTSFNLIHTADIEPLNVRAVNVDKIDNVAFSDIYPDDILRYDIEPDTLIVDSSGEWEDDTNTNGELNFSNWTSTSIDVDKHLIIDDNFYLYAEDDNGSFEWSSANIGVDLEVTYPSADVTRITQTTQHINFTAPAYNYGELESSYKAGDKTGEIYYREDPVKKIKCFFDFRGTAHARKRIDSSTIPDYAAGNHSKNDLVKNNNNVYKCLHDTDQAYNTAFWILGATDIDNSYNFTRPTLGNIYVVLDDTPKMIPVFSYWNGSDYVEDYNKISNVVFKSRSVVCPRASQNTAIQNVLVEEGAQDITIAGSVQNVTFPRHCQQLNVDKAGNLQNLDILNGISYTTLNGWFANSKIINIRNSIIHQANDSEIGDSHYLYIVSLNRSQLGSSCSYVALGSIENSSFGSNWNNVYIFASYYNKIGNSCSGLEATVNGFSNNEIGDLWKNFKINHTFTYNRIGTLVGNLSGIETHGDWYANDIGNFCFTAANNNYFGHHVNNNSIGNKVDQLRVNGTISGSVLHNNITHIFCANMYNTVINSACHSFDFTGNIQQCIFEPGTNNITSTTALIFNHNTVADGYMTLDGTCGLPYDNVKTKMYRSDGQPRLEYRDNKDRLIVLDPTTCEEIIPDVKYNAFNEPLFKFSAEDGLSVTGQSNNSCPGVMGFSQPNGVACSGLKTYDEAVQWCADQGGRLPTIIELEQNSTRGTGCGYDAKLCWSQSPSPTEDHYWVCKGRDGDDLQEKEKTDTAYVRVVYDKFRRN